MKNLAENCNVIGNSNNDVAREFYSLGFNVIPLKKGTKMPIGHWRILQASRLPEYWPERLFEDRNIGVITGRTSMNLFVLDCDSIEAFNDWAEKLHSYGLDKWAISSYNGGHFWFLSTDGEVKHIYKKREDSVAPEDNYQIWGNKHYMVIPPSIRFLDSGGSHQYTWMNREGELPPKLETSQIEYLFPDYRVVHPLRNGNITDLAYKVIVKHSKGKYPSFSEAEYAATLSLIRIGWSDEQIINLFIENQPPHFVKRNSDEEWLSEHIVIPARNFIDKKPNYILNNVIAWAEERRWEGRSRASDYLVFCACIERARMEKNPFNFRATIREIAEIGNHNDGTVEDSLHRLIEKGILLVMNDQSQIDLKTSSYYRFAKEVTTYRSSENPICDYSSVLTSDLRKHDVWHYYGLGKSALFVYEYLLNFGKSRGETINEIRLSTENRIGAKNETIKKTLFRLQEYGLVNKLNDRWFAIYASTEKLDAIAEEKGVFGTLQKRIAKHKQELANYALYTMMPKHFSKQRKTEDH